MIRPVTAADSAAVVDLAVSAGLFSSDDAAVVEQMMLDYATTGQARGHRCVIDVDHGSPVDAEFDDRPGGEIGRPVGAAYYEQAALGYERAARVRDYYAAGDDMAVFRKRLADR